MGNLVGGILGVKHAEGQVTAQGALGRRLGVAVGAVGGGRGAVGGGSRTVGRRGGAIGRRRVGMVVEVGSVRPNEGDRKY